LKIILVNACRLTLVDVSRYFINFFFFFFFTVYAVRKISRFSCKEMLCTQNSIFFPNFLSLNNFYCITRIYQIYVIPSCAILWHAAVYCRLAQLFKISEGKIPSTKEIGIKIREITPRIKLSLINILFRSVVISRSDILFWSL